MFIETKYFRKSWKFFNLRAESFQNQNVFQALCDQISKNTKHTRISKTEISNDDMTARYQGDKMIKHRKNCEYCPRHFLFKGHNVIVNIVRNLKIFRKSENFPKI